MTAPLTPGERLALLAWLEKEVKRLRGELLPATLEAMPPGTRLPAIFGGRQAGWVSMPKPSTTAAVTDPGAFLAWTRKNVPGRIREDVTIDQRQMDDVLALIEDHMPDALIRTTVVDPAWQGDLLASLRDRGRYALAGGDVITEVPGITVSTGEPRPRVNLADDAGEVIEQAWRAGEIDMLGVLALPAPPEPEPEPAPPVPEPAGPGDEPGVPPLFAPGGPMVDEQGRFRTPEAAAIHAVTVQGGFTTPARESRRMVADGRRGGDLEQGRIGLAWLRERGLSPDGEAEPDGTPDTSRERVDDSGGPGVG
ncbi:MAG: hypothetical protein M0030_30490 [Actinomycetota bacterium]|nr:hypothetical protein [Actinomycetota bacterium]